MSKKPFYKKWWFWILAIIILGSLGQGVGQNNKSKSTATQQEQKKESGKQDVGKKAKEEKNNEKKEERKINTPIKQTSPKEVTETYFLAWKNKDYKSMYEVAQSIWKKNNKPDVIDAWYDFKTLEGFEIKSEEENNMKIGDKNLIMTKVTVKATYKAFQNRDEIKTIIVNAVKEEGKWWVNPTSALEEN